MHFDSASFLAGIIGTAATNPIDVIKVCEYIINVYDDCIPLDSQSRMMNQTVLRQEATHLYSSSIDCFITVSQYSNSFIEHVTCMVYMVQSP